MDKNPRDSRKRLKHSESDIKLKRRKPEKSSLLQNNEFSFLYHKKDLNRILLYNCSDASTVVSDTEDFWLFVKKYEDLMKKAGKLLLETNAEFKKIDCINIIPILKYFDVGSYERKNKLNAEVFKKFVDVVALYLDFKNKEKFSKLKKLRQAQASLPVAKYREEIVSSVINNRVTIVAGDTGCGKSTQVPQYLSQAGFKNIACTQPRRIACISLAKRVAYESLSQFGTEVGYQIRFERSRSSVTNICFITEGLLLRQIASESSLSNYDIIILDEIHERHLHGDFLLGVLKCLIQNRSDLKLVLMSATININLFKDYFHKENAVVIQVPGRLYPIELNYKPVFVEGRQTKSDRLDPQPYVQIMQLIDSKYPSSERGDLLIFMSGIKEITSICDAAQQYADKTKKWIVLSLHSTLSINDQDKVFDYPPEGVRKCIVSTNIAETSVTIDGIRFVVDSGKVKEMSYDSSCRMQILKEFWISKASAEQRKGRAGRTGPGVCYRLYSEEDYSKLDDFATPEIARVPLASLLLSMISLGMNDVRKFPFLDAPPPQTIENALIELKKHGALTSNEKLTQLGRSLSNLPVDVSLAKALVLSVVTLPLHKSDSGIALTAVLGVQSPFTGRAHRDLDCENARKADESDHGDPLTLLSLYCAWLCEKSNSGSGSTRKWCSRRGLEEQRFYEVTKLATQFKTLLQDAKLFDVLQPETMSSSERSIRHGQLKQLKEMRRKHKEQTALDSKRGKRLKMSSWELVDPDNDDKDDTPDIRDIEFRLTNDAARIQGLISGASTSSGRDLMTLKLVLCRAIYPQIAVADDFNHCKTVSEQLYHTSSKSFVSLHPTSYFGRNPRTLVLEESDIITENIAGFKSKLPVSCKHQILCYLSLLETSKPYLMNSMRMPAAQTLLLISHNIDTNLSVNRILCDSWLLLEFPYPDSGINLLIKANKLRKRWDQIIDRRLEEINPETSVEGELKKSKISNKSREQCQYDLSCDLSEYLNTQVYYTIKRLLPADLKGIYLDSEGVQTQVMPNPFCDGFDCHPDEKKGGVCVSDNIVYNCVKDTDWSYAQYQEALLNPWVCPKCHLTMCLPSLERLQHTQFTCSGIEIKTDELKSVKMITNPNAKEYNCKVCNGTLYLTPVDILRHKKNCK